MNIPLRTQIENILDELTDICCDKVPSDVEVEFHLTREHSYAIILDKSGDSPRGELIMQPFIEK